MRAGLTSLILCLAVTVSHALSSPPVTGNQPGIPRIDPGQSAREHPEPLRGRVIDGVRYTGADLPPFGELDEGPYLVLSTYHEHYSIISDVLDSLEIDHEFMYDSRGRWNLYELEEFNTVIVNFYYGYTTEEGMEALHDYCSDGGKVIVFGGTSYGQDEYGEGMELFVHGHSWLRYSRSPGFIMDDPDHVLAEGLPDTVHTYLYCNLYWYRANDDTAEVIARNSDGWPTFLYKDCGSGLFFMVQYTTYRWYWDEQEGDLQMLIDIYDNIFNYEGRSHLLGVVSDAETGEPLEDVVVEVRVQDADTVWAVDTTDAEGTYDIQPELNPAWSYDVSFSKRYYVNRVREDIAFDPPVDCELDISLTPYFEADLRELQTEVETGTWVITGGIVTQPANSTTTDYLSVCIADTTGYGIHVFDENPRRWGEILRSDSVVVAGRLSEDENVTRLTELEELTVISNDHPLPHLHELGTAEASQAADFEGSWVRTGGYLAAEPANDGGTVYYSLDDGSGEVHAVIYPATNIRPFAGFGVGDWFHTDGVLTVLRDTVRIIPSLRGDIWRSEILPPLYLRGSFDDSTGMVTIQWEHESISPITQLVYDDGRPDDYIRIPGHTFAVRMSPERECRLLGLRFMVNNQDTVGTFDAEIYRWNDYWEVPGNYSYYDGSVRVDLGEGWVEKQVADEDIIVNGDFVVGFGSVDFNIEIGMDETDNGRGWDYTGGEWTQYGETYFIRSIVQYTDNGDLAVLGPRGGDGELDGWREFVVYRNGEEVARTEETEYSETLPDYGEFRYVVTASYHEGESPGTDPWEIFWEQMEEGIGGTADVEGLPTEWAIESVYPNPFNPAVNAVIAVPDAQRVKVELFNLVGRNVATLIDRELRPGYHRFSWRPEGPTGMYFLRVTAANSWTGTEKILYLK